MVSRECLYFIATISVLSVSTLTSCHRFDSIYQFGDSFSDTGNLPIEDRSVAICGRRPYGETFFNEPTGRCSNGRLIVDFIAKAYNISYLNPYLDRDADFSQGVNFAVAGATALSPADLAEKGIASPVTNSSLSDQLHWFKSHLKSLCSDQTECKAKLRNALFRVGEIGGNDFNFAVLGGQNADAVADLIPDVVRSILNATEELIDLGATYLVVPGNYPIGCSPLYLANDETTKVYDDLGCLKPTNEIVFKYNERLQEGISKLQRERKDGVKVVYADYYNAFFWLFRNAKMFGFDEAKRLKACCGKGDNEYNMAQSLNCGSEGVTACSEPERLISWDGVHLTEKAHDLIVKRLLKDMHHAR